MRPTGSSPRSCRNPSLREARALLALAGARLSGGGRPAKGEFMHYGVFIFPTDYSIRIDELARAAEERGFESLFVTEHTHIPTNRPSPVAGGGPLPQEASHTLDPVVGLTPAPAATRRLQVG